MKKASTIGMALVYFLKIEQGYGFFTWHSQVKRLRGALDGEIHFCVCILYPFLKIFPLHGDMQENTQTPSSKTKQSIHIYLCEIKYKYNCLILFTFIYLLPHSQCMRY